MNFFQECYYCQIWMGVVVFTKVHRQEKSLDICKNCYSHSYFAVVFHYLEILNLKIWRKNHYWHSSYNAVLLYRGILSSMVFSKPKTALKILSNTFFSQKMEKKIKTKKKKSISSTFSPFFLVLICKRISQKASQPIIRLHFHCNILITFGNAFFFGLKVFWLDKFITFFIEYFAQKVDFGSRKVPFSCFSTKILLLYRGFPLTWFYWVAKNCVKGGVPVLWYFEFKCHKVVEFSFLFSR